MILFLVDLYHRICVSDYNNGIKLASFKAYELNTL